VQDGPDAISQQLLVSSAYRRGGLPGFTGPDVQVGFVSGTPASSSGSFLQSGVDSPAFRAAWIPPRLLCPRIPQRTGRPTTATGWRRMVRRPGGGVESASSPVPLIDRRRARPTTATGRRRTVSRSGSGVESLSYPLSSISLRRCRPMTATGRRRIVSRSGCGC
jgi:hypothetical protein